tara:strand:+ start:425 stop:694 length:270 start_codon:yes stop_codon:yes gene_type:complete
MAQPKQLTRVSLAVMVLVLTLTEQTRLVVEVVALARWALTQPLQLVVMVGQEFHRQSRVRQLGVPVAVAVEREQHKPLERQLTAVATGL